MKIKKHEQAWIDHCRLNRSVSPFMRVMGTRSGLNPMECALMTQNYFSQKSRSRMLGKTIDFNAGLKRYMTYQKPFKTQEITCENGVRGNKKRIEIDKHGFTPMGYKTNCTEKGKWITSNSKSTIVMNHWTKNLRKKKVMKSLLKTLKKIHQTKHRITTSKYSYLFPVKEFQLLKSKEFLAMVKGNNIEKARELLKENKYLIYQHDRVN